MSHHNINVFNVINISMQSGTLKGTLSHILEIPTMSVTCVALDSHVVITSNHTKSVHMEEKNHKCDICKKHFRRKEYLDAHALKHSGENPHHCLVCNKSFSVKRYLKKHVCTKEPKPISKCLVCDKVFRNNKCLKQHLLKQVFCHILHCRFCYKLLKCNHLCC